MHAGRRNAEGGGGLGEAHVLGREEQPLEVRVGGGLGQHVEDGAAVVVQKHDDQRRRPCGSAALEQHLALERQAGEVVQQREVAGEKRRLGEVLRHPHRRRDHAVDAVLPAIGHHGQGLAVFHVEGVHGADAHGIRRKETRAFRRQLEKRAHVGAFRGLGIVGGHTVPFHGENAQARLVVEGDPGISEAVLGLAALGAPSAAHEPEGCRAHEHVRRRVEIARLGNINGQGDGTHALEQSGCTFRDRIATEADDHLGHGAVGASAEVVVVVDDKRVVDGAQARQRIGKHRQRQLARPSEDLLCLGHSLAGALAGEHQRGALPQKALDGLDTRRGQCAGRANKRAQIKKSAVLRGDAGIAGTQSEAIASGALHGLQIGASEIGLERGIEGEVHVHGAGQVHAGAGSHLHVRVVVHNVAGLVVEDRLERIGLFSGCARKVVSSIPRGSIGGSIGDRGIRRHRDGGSRVHRQRNGGSRIRRQRGGSRAS